MHNNINDIYKNYKWVEFLLQVILGEMILYMYVLYPNQNILSTPYILYVKGLTIINP